MTSLIVRSGLTKTAAPEDGPSFEQQFGILANAVIVEKFPQLDNMKLAFQLIDKNDDNSNAVGAMVYMLGNTVIFVPAFFKNQQLKTADMMFIAQSQQFLPMADPWLAYIRDKDLKPSGEAVDKSEGVEGATADSTMVREYADPITKTATCYLKMLGSLPFDITASDKSSSVLDTALAFGKEATCNMCDQLVENASFMNSMLEFYSGDEIDRFAKIAAAMGEEEEPVKLILPFTKEAAGLFGDDLIKLQTDGYLVKSATEGTDSVMVKPQLNNMFGTITEPCHAKLLGIDGSLNPVTILRMTDQHMDSIDYDVVPEPEPSDVKHPGDPGVTANKYMKDGTKGYAVLYDGKITKLPTDSMILLSSKRKFSVYDLFADSEKLSNKDKLDYDTWLIYPDGTCQHWDYGAFEKDEKGRWITGHSWGTYHVVVEGVNGEQVSPMRIGDMLVVPAGTRCIVSDSAKSALPCSPVTLGTFEAFLNEFCKKHYDKARVYSNGSDITVSGDKTASVHPMGKGEAAFELVRDYGVDPDIARSMLKEACSTASYDSPNSVTFYITKTAADPGWQDAGMPVSEHTDRPPQTNYMAMPTVLESPEQLQKAVETAAQNGIKEVFDVTALKLLVKQTRFFDGIQEDMPLFMRTLDSLCRKLFQFYWHTDKMEEKYGMVKLKDLENSLKATIDSLSELTIFFKLRTVDGTGSTGDTAGELMSGQML